jgi:hypothetical protein
MKLPIPIAFRRRRDGGWIDQRRAELKPERGGFPACDRAMDGCEQRAEARMRQKRQVNRIDVYDQRAVVEMDVAVAIPDGGGDRPLEAPARLCIFGNDRRADAEKNDRRHAAVLERTAGFRARTRAVVPVVNQDGTLCTRVDNPSK